MGITNVAKVLVINSRNEVLILTRSSTDTHRPGKLDIPGGGIDLNEDPFSAAQRELSEETGIDISKESLQLLYMGTVFEESLNESVNRILFSCHVDSPNVTLSYEHSDFQWVPFDTLADVYRHHFYTPAMSYARSHGLLPV